MIAASTFGIWSGRPIALIGVTLAIAAIAACVDVRRRRLPNVLLAIAAIPVGAQVARSLVGGSSTPLTGTLLGALVLASPLFVVHVVSPAALGFGDVKLGAVLGSSIGLVDPRLGIVALFLASGGTVVVAATMRRRELPLGPGLVLGATCAVLFAGLTGLEIAS